MAVVVVSVVSAVVVVEDEDAMQEGKMKTTEKGYGCGVGGHMGSGHDRGECTG